jgi:hypothetical protein
MSEPEHEFVSASTVWRMEISVARNPSEREFLS